MTGDQLKSWRQSKDMSRKELGDEFGVSEHTVAKWEQDVNPIPKAVVRLVSSPPRMEFSVDEFLEIKRIADESGRSIDDVCVQLIRERLRNRG